MHPAEQARLTHRERWQGLDRKVNVPLSSVDDRTHAVEVYALDVGPSIEPGSIEEQRALDRIDELRELDKDYIVGAGSDSLTMRACSESSEIGRRRGRRAWARRGTR
jgi:hypothetical protein